MLMMCGMLDETLLSGDPDINIIIKEIPEFSKCFGLTQNHYHFGDVAEHSLAVLHHHCEMFEPNLAERLACLLHDIGKIRTRTVKDGKIHFYNHEYAGEKMSRKILERLGYNSDIIDDVAFLIRNHMRTKQAGENGEMMKDKTLKKILRDCGDDVEKFKSLMRVIECDNLSHAADHNIIGQYSGLVERAINIIKN